MHGNGPTERCISEPNKPWKWTSKGREREADDICAEALEDWKRRGEQGKPYELFQRLGRIDETVHWADLPSFFIVILGEDLCECEKLHTPDQPACQAVVFDEFDHKYWIDSVDGLAKAIQAACPDARVEIRY